MAAQTSGRIVVGIDGSAASTDALRWAARQAELTGSPLEVIMTWEWPASLGWSVPIPDGYDPETDVRQILDAAVEAALAEHPDVTVDRRVVNGHPAPAAGRRLQGRRPPRHGSRGHGEFVGMLLGSVSEFCTTNAHCPVLVHRPVFVAAAPTRRLSPAGLRARGPAASPAASSCAMARPTRGRRLAVSAQVEERGQRGLHRGRQRPTAS